MVYSFADISTVSIYNPDIKNINNGARRKALFIWFHSCFHSNSGYQFSKNKKLHLYNVTSDLALFALCNSNDKKNRLCILLAI